MKTFLVIGHVLAVVSGVGGALLLDIYFLRHLRGAIITAQDVAFTEFVGIFAKAGLVALWASGIAILSVAPDGPASVLANPKVQAKLVIVVVLTLNALFVETVALPLVQKNVGRTLFEGVTEIRQACVLVCGAISSVSWLAPVVLGLARELNHVVPAASILMVYAWVLSCVAIAAQAAALMLYRPKKSEATDDAGVYLPEERAEEVLTFHAAAREALELSLSSFSRPHRRAGRETP